MVKIVWVSTRTHATCVTQVRNKRLLQFIKRFFKFYLEVFQIVDDAGQSDFLSGDRRDIVHRLGKRGRQNRCSGHNAQFNGKVGRTKQTIVAFYQLRCHFLFALVSFKKRGQPHRRRGGDTPFSRQSLPD